MYIIKKGDYKNSYLLFMKSTIFGSPYPLAFHAEPKVI